MPTTTASEQHLQAKYDALLDAVWNMVHYQIKHENYGVTSDKTNARRWRTKAITLMKKEKAERESLQGKIL